MPPLAVPYTPRPFARDGRLAELILARGAQAADMQLRAGQLRGQGLGTLGNLLGGTVQQIAEDRQQAPIRAQQARLRELQLADAEREAGEPARLAAQDQAFLQLMESSPDGNPDPRKVVGIYGPQRGLTIATGLMEFNQLRKGTVESPQDAAKRLGAAFKALKTPALQQAFWPQVKDAAVKAGLVAADGVPDTFSPDVADALFAWGSGAAPAATKLEKVTTRDAQGHETTTFVEPTAGQTFTSVPEVKRYPVTTTGPRGEKLERLATEAEMAQGVPGYVAPVREPVTKPNYEWAFDPQKGANVLATPEEIRAKGYQKPTGSQRAASGVEKRAMGFFNRARQADVDLEGLEPEIQGMGLSEQAYMAAAPNFMQTETGQRYTQAQRAFTEARLRKDSGAAIPEQEFANDRRTYFAQPGDSASTLQQKRRARAAVLASLGSEAGQALVEFEGDGAAASALVEGYKARAKASGDDGWTVINGVRIRQKPSR